MDIMTLLQVMPDVFGYDCLTFMVDCLDEEIEIEANSPLDFFLNLCYNKKIISAQQTDLVAFALTKGVLMNKYELSVVFHPDLEMNFDPALEKVKQILKSAKANIIKEENDGKKRLAYPIEGQEYGIYYYMDVELPSEGPSKISNVLNITDEILRYLLVKTDEKKEKLAAAKAEKAEKTEKTDESKKEEE